MCRINARKRDPVWLVAIQTQKGMEESMPIYRLNDRIPAIAEGCFIAPDAAIIGDVHVEMDANIWFGAVLRGDNEKIVIGSQSSVQDGVVMHTDPGFPLTIGTGVTVGHQATLHGCTIGDGTLVGMQAIVLNGASVAEDCLIGAGALITERKQFPSRSLIVGVPAVAVRELTDEEVDKLRQIAIRYVDRAHGYREHLECLDNG